MSYTTNQESPHSPGCPRYSGFGECDCDTNGCYGSGEPSADDPVVEVSGDTSPSLSQSAQSQSQRFGVIEKGIPLAPDGRGAIGRKFIYPFVAMGIGDSFLMPAKSASSIDYYRKKFPERKFTLRKVDANYVRVWRLK